MLDNHHHGGAHLTVWLPQPLGVVSAPCVSLARARAFAATWGER